MDEEVRKTLDEIKKSLDDYGLRISELEKLIKSKPVVVQDKKLSLKEFILSKNPKGEVEMTLAIGYYLEKYEGVSSFNVKDLENGFAAAKEKTPLNINDKVNLNT